MRPRGRERVTSTSSKREQRRKRDSAPPWLLPRMNIYLRGSHLIPREELRTDAGSWKDIEMIQCSYQVVLLIIRNTFLYFIEPKKGKTSPGKCYMWGQLFNRSLAGICRYEHNSEAKMKYWNNTWRFLFFYHC